MIEQPPGNSCSSLVAAASISTKHFALSPSAKSHCGIALVKAHPGTTEAASYQNDIISRGWGFGGWVIGCVPGATIPFIRSGLHPSFLPSFHSIHSSWCLIVYSGSQIIRNIPFHSFHPDPSISLGIHSSIHLQCCYIFQELRPPFGLEKHIRFNTPAIAKAEESRIKMAITLENGEQHRISITSSPPTTQLPRW